MFSVILTCTLAHKRLLSPFQTTFECRSHTWSRKPSTPTKNVSNLKEVLSTIVSLH